MSAPDPNGHVYLTSKARMIAESRMRFADVLSQIIMAWYSICLIGISLLDLSQTYLVRDVSVMTAILSTAVLGASVFLPGRNFSVRAERFRDCYLHLQRIYRSALPDEEKGAEYGKILPLYENHTQADYEWVLFQSWLFQKPLADTSGPIIVTKPIIFKCAIRATFTFVFLAALLVMPLIFGYLLVTPRAG